MSGTGWLGVLGGPHLMPETWLRHDPLPLRGEGERLSTAPDGVVNYE
jgi:hypothetical protein